MQNNIDIPRSEWEKLIDEWIFNERDREILKRRLLDGVCYEPLAEEFNLSMQARKTSKNAKYFLICLTDLIKYDKIILPLIKMQGFLLIFALQKKPLCTGWFFISKKIKFFFKKSIDK